jgi:hypothetical protein
MTRLLDDLPNLRARAVDARPDVLAEYDYASMRRRMHGLLAEVVARRRTDTGGGAGSDAEESSRP